MWMYVMPPNSTLKNGPIEHAALCSLRARWAGAEPHTGAPFPSLPRPQSCGGLWDCTWTTAKLLTGFSQLAAGKSARPGQLAGLERALWAQGYNNPKAQPGLKGPVLLWWQKSGSGSAGRQGWGGALWSTLTPKSLDSQNLSLLPGCGI